MTKTYHLKHKACGGQIASDYYFDEESQEESEFFYCQECNDSADELEGLETEEKEQ